MSFVSPKKRKYDPPQTDQEKTKKLKQFSQSRPTLDSKDKGKSRSADGEFTIVQSTLRLAIAPVFASNPKAGAEEMLDSMVMRYIPAFRGVVLAHSNIRFLNSMAKIISDCPYIVCDIGFDATIWSPHVGLQLAGKINLCSPDHISLLVHRTFNVSIPRHHIPTDEWQFEYGAADNDPEFGPNAVLDDADASGAQIPEEHGDVPGGKWVHKITGEKLGGPSGNLDFIVIGLTVANEMLSLQGSIQADPFSPEHIPIPTPLLPTASTTSDDEAAVDPSTDVHADDDDESDEDTFQTYGKISRKAAIQKREALGVDGLKKKKRKTEEGKEKSKKRKKS